MIGGWWFALEAAKEDAKKLHGENTGARAHQSLGNTSESWLRDVIAEDTTDEIHAAGTTTYRDRHVSP
jgi:hypothetical protein